MLTLNEKNGSRVVIVESDDIVLTDEQSALDIMADASYEHGSRKIVIYKKNICDDFFELKTKIAGEILQKYTNYFIKIAIVGDFDELVANSKSLRDFIYECNNGTQVFFVPTLDAALERLHAL